MIDGTTLVLLIVLCVGWLGVGLWIVYICATSGEIPTGNIRPPEHAPGERKGK